MPNELSEAVASSASQEAAVSEGQTDAASAEVAAGGDGSAAGDVAESIYDKAFSDFLDPAASTPPDNGQEAAAGEEAGQATEQSQEQAAPDQQAAAGSTDEAAADPPGGLTSEETQLLSRMHMTPAMVEGWKPEDRRAFLDNAAKRETDQASNYGQLRTQLDTLTAKVEQSGEQQAAQAKAAETPPPKDLATQAQETVNGLIDVFGDEMKPLGPLMEAFASQNDALVQQVENVQADGQIKDQLLVEMTIDVGLRDLAGDYPSLDKADARQKVVTRFQEDWRSETSPHRTGQGPILERIRAALKSAASAEFSNTTESAAQVALANTTKQRLQNQPKPGAGKGRSVPQSEDQQYDQAFADTIGAEIHERR